MTDTAKIRRPDDIAATSVTELAGELGVITWRVFMARHWQRSEVSSDDLFAELAYRTRIAQEVTAGRWCTVADLVRSGGAESWAEIGDALGLTETDTRDGFHGWIAGQVDLYEQTGIRGLTGDQAEELHRLSEVITW